MNSEDELYEDQEDDGATPREDEEYFCCLRMRTVLILSGTCFCRIHDSNCGVCVFDQSPKDRILARVLMALADALNKQRSQK